nr:helix-turn-helix domain-containing protein [Lewinella sp. JB7]
MPPVNNTLVRKVIDRLRTAEEPSTRQTILATFGHWKTTSAGKHRQFHRVLTLLHDADGPRSVSELRTALGISERHLQRLFRAQAGVPPKLYLRLLRFERAYHFLLNHPPLPNAEVAFRHGFADGAHLSREFRSFCGATPRMVRTAAPLSS